MEFESESQFPGTLSLRVFDSAAALAQAVAGRVQEAVMTGVRSRRRASLVLAASPVLRRGYELLSGIALPWEHAEIVLGDSANLPPTDEASGERFVRSTLLRERAARARWVPLWPPSVAPADAARAAEEQLGAMALPHDLVLLALNAEGHIDALAAPEPRESPAGTARAARVVLRHEHGVSRLTLTPSALLDSERIVIVAQGLAARDGFERALLAPDAPPSALRSLTREASQAIEFCWCR